MSARRVIQRWIVLVIVALATMFIGTSPLVADAAHPLANGSGLRLTVPFIHQYFNDPTSADCGPASLAMVLDAYSKRPVSMKGNDKAFLKAVRDATGKPDVHAYTGVDDLTQALRDPMFQIPYTVIPKGTNPLTREQNLQLIKDAVAQRKPVVMLIDSNTLGRGYNGHWVVVTGFSSDNQYVFVNDPDLRTAQPPKWDKRAPGGQTRWPYDLFKDAANAAGDKNYGIVIGAGLPDTAVAPPQLGELGGIVRDSAGQGVANATVILAYGQGIGSVTKTDFAGHYVFQDISADTATLIAIRGRTGKAIDVSVGSNASTQAPDLILTDPGTQQIALPMSGQVRVNFISTGSPGDQTACSGDFGLQAPNQRMIYPNYLYFAGLPLELGASAASSQLVFSLAPTSFCTGTTYLSTDSQRALILRPNEHTWIVAWEDYTDVDFNDLVVRVDLQAQPLPFLSLPFAQPQTPNASGAFPLAFVSGFMDHQYPSSLAAPNDHWAYRVSFRGDDSQIEGNAALDGASFDGSDGTDFQLTTNTATWATAQGVVTFAGTQQISCAPKRTTLNAKVVKVRHNNGYVTEYWWLNSIAQGIATGVTVTPGSGAVLGYSGTNRCSDKAGLHFVVRNPDGYAVDPFGWRPQPDSPWYGLDDPWKQYNDVLGRKAGSDHLWMLSAGNTQLVTPDQTTTLTSSDARMTISVPAYAFSQPVRLELADAGSTTTALNRTELVLPIAVAPSVSAANLKTLRSFALFGYTIGDEVVTTAQQDIAIDVRAPSVHVPQGISPQIYIRGSDPFEAARWRPLPTTWDASTGHAHASTRELGTFMLAWETTRIFLPTIRR
jgi:murein DD-endopeptidase MepM/ murein hydrolase activator NlpD